MDFIRLLFYMLWVRVARERERERVEEGMIGLVSPSDGCSSQCCYWLAQRDGLSAPNWQIIWSILATTYSRPGLY